MGDSQSVLDAMAMALPAPGQFQKVEGLAVSRWPLLTTRSQMIAFSIPVVTAQVHDTCWHIHGLLSRTKRCFGNSGLA